MNTSLRLKDPTFLCTVEYCWAAEMSHEEAMSKTGKTREEVEAIYQAEDIKFQAWVVANGGVA